jgi:GDPmannose 4,6-dehydratase
VEGMWKILNYDKPDDFVLGTGELHTVREFVKEAFKVTGINIRWEGSGLDEKGVSDDGRILVKINKEFFRPLDTNPFIADYSKARMLLNW